MNGIKVRREGVTALSWTQLSPRGGEMSISFYWWCAEYDDVESRWHGHMGLKTTLDYLDSEWKVVNRHLHAYVKAKIAWYVQYWAPVFEVIYSDANVYHQLSSPGWNNTTFDRLGKSEAIFIAFIIFEKINVLIEETTKMWRYAEKHINWLSTCKKEYLSLGSQLKSVRCPFMYSHDFQ